MVLSYHKFFIIFAQIQAHMSNHLCPNIKGCRLVIAAVVVPDDKRRNEYLTTYCKAGEEKWSLCKRFITKQKLNFCPDFVLPDTQLTPDEIIDKFDEENNN